VSSPTDAFDVPLNGFSMRLRQAELESVAAGLGREAASDHVVLAAALRRLPAAERAPTWELVVRHVAHGKPLEVAAGEIGLDAIWARELLERYRCALADAR
jgi:hypothetical protein